MSIFIDQAGLTAMAVLDEIAAAGARAVVVTKYYDSENTAALWAKLKGHPAVWGRGENRVEKVTATPLPRDTTHWIGRLQGRQLPAVVEHCGVVHSLCAERHAVRLASLQGGAARLRCLVQVNVGGDPSKAGILPSVVAEFLRKCAGLGLEVVGLSTMSWADASDDQRLAEYAELVRLKDLHLPEGITSGGTSRDWWLALAAGVDVVRIGQVLSPLIE